MGGPLSGWQQANRILRFKASDAFPLRLRANKTDPAAVVKTVLKEQALQVSQGSYGRHRLHSHSRSRAGVRVHARRDAQAYDRAGRLLQGFDPPCFWGRPVRKKKEVTGDSPGQSRQIVPAQASYLCYQSHPFEPFGRQRGNLFHEAAAAKQDHAGSVSFLRFRPCRFSRRRSDPLPLLRGKGHQRPLIFRCRENPLQSSSSDA